jgi:hypothetical protein
MTKEFEDMRADAERYWEKRYQTGSAGSSGRPGTARRQFVEPPTPGRALELG